MDNIPEREGRKPIREFPLGEEFPLFDKQYLTDFELRHEFATFMQLHIEPNIALRFAISGFPLKATRLHALTPFDPNDGYHIDHRDFEVKARIKKILDNQKELSQNVNSSRSPNLLFVRTYYIPVPEESKVNFEKPSLKMNAPRSKLRGIRDLA